MDEGRFVFRGRLEEDSLPEMLATIHRHRVPGVMEVRRNDLSKRVYILDGDVIFADSDDPEERLGTMLLEEGKISRVQLKVSSDELKRSTGKRHGEVLVDLGFLPPEELGPAVRRQVQRILWDLFNWEAGAVTFQVGRFREDEVFKITIPTPRAILDGCRRITDGRRVTVRLGGRNTVLRPLPPPRSLAGLRLQSGERELLEMVDGRKTLFELCEEGPFSAGINARILFAFSALRLVEAEKRPSSGVRIQVRQPGGETEDGQ